MSSSKSQASVGRNARDATTSDMVKKLADELDGVLDLKNTEDVDQDTKYAPAVTHEVVKPVVHEKIEEHITRDTHTYDEYTKILPVKDVEVLPPRHWVPGPDGRLVQVDEKDVYSGAAWTFGQGSSRQTTDFTQTQTLQSKHGHVDQVGDSGFSTQRGMGDAETHTSINSPQVVPAQVKQVYQTQTHHYDVDQHLIPRKPVNQEYSAEQHVAFVEPGALQRSLGGQESAVRQTDPGHYAHQHLHSAVEHEDNRSQPNQEQVATSVQSSVYSTPTAAPRRLDDSMSARQLEASQATQSQRLQTHQQRDGQYQTYDEHVGHRQSENEELNRKNVLSREPGPAQSHQPLQPATIHQETRQYQPPSTHVHEGSPDQREIDEQLYREQATRVDASHHPGHQGQFMPQGQAQPATQTDQHSSAEHGDSGNSHGQDKSRVEGQRLSPGLLDPYRVKNGPLHHQDDDRPDTHEKKIAGHSILTADDDAGHTRLHKEPKEGKSGLR